jgi:hypothetical protein
MKSRGLQRQTTLVEHPKDFWMSAGTIRMSAETIHMSAGNFQMSIGNSDGVLST